MQRIAAGVLVMCLVACAGCSSSGRSAVPQEARDLESDLKSSMADFMPLVPDIQSGFVFILNTGSPGAQGIAIQPDQTMGAPPNRFTFSGMYDVNSDSIQETELAGSVTFASDPASDWSGLNGEVSLDGNLPVLGHLYHADISFTMNEQGEQNVLGGGTFTDPLSGHVTTVTIPSGSPLVVKPATGAADSVSNTCGYSMDGQLQVEVASDDGTLSSEWNFRSDSSRVAIRNGTFLDALGQLHPIPDATITLPCGSSTLSSWAGTYLQNWACIPWEYGQARLTLSVADADTINITDEDPPGSGDTNTYHADVVGGSPLALRGFFDGGVAPNVYREDFSWTLGRDGGGFSDFAIYTYTSGPKTGDGGLCVGSARPE